MDYIVDPMIFYWIYVLTAFKHVLIGIFTISGTILLSSIIGYFCITIDDDSNLYRIFIRKAPKIIKTSIILIVVSISINLFIPNQQTLYAMLIAHTITQQNIEGAVNFTQDNINKIINNIADAAIRVKNTDK